MSGSIILTQEYVQFIYSYCREASSQEEFCKLPRKRYVDIGTASDPELTNRMYQACIKSEHPSVHICKKLPKKGFARKTHRQLKHLLKKLKKRGKGRKSKGKNRKGKKLSGKGKRGGRRRNNIGRVRGSGVRASHVVEI